MEALQTESCTRPEGYAEQIGDCDDSNLMFIQMPMKCAILWTTTVMVELTMMMTILLASSTSYFFEDNDGDGYGSGVAQGRCKSLPGLVDNSEDCDDSNLLINPESAEVCDGIDNDCDGLLDDADDSLSGATTYYADGDRDGFGDLNQTTFDVFFENYVDNSLDCNDANPSITLPLWYLDNDGDGDGDINNTFENCEPPENYVQNSGDCDDNNPEISSIATEVCNGIDDDCDELIDTDDELGSFFWYGCLFGQ